MGFIGAVPDSSLWHACPGINAPGIGIKFVSIRARNSRLSGAGMAGGPYYDSGCGGGPSGIRR